MAKYITLFRTLLALIAVSLLFFRSAAAYWTAFSFTVLAMLLDGLDGYVARKYNEVSKTGAVLDIMSDRIVENVYWISFMALGWLPVWVPLLVVIRGIITDSLRSIAYEQGFTAFGESSMVKGRIGSFIVVSKTGRFAYAFAKAAAFSLLIAGHIPGVNHPLTDTAAGAGYIFTGAALFLCIARALPVIAGSRRFFWQMK
jgi:CDP-diacylglycerol--glycerol-3-phosphate 3-phosphatidyltransferase